MTSFKDKSLIGRRGILGGMAGVSLFAAFGSLIRDARAAKAVSLSSEDRRLVDDIERFLNGLTTVKARFVQSASNGSYSEGQIYVERPDHMRMDYDPPVPLLIIADGLALALYDRELKQVTQLPLWETPLWFLFKDRIRLADNLVITYFTHNRGGIVMTIQEEQAEGNLASVTLTFSKSPIELRKWEVVDPQGLIVQTGLINPEYGLRLDPKLFSFKELEIYDFQRNRDRGR